MTGLREYDMIGIELIKRGTQITLCSGETGCVRGERREKLNRLRSEEQAGTRLVVNR